MDYSLEKFLRHIQYEKRYSAHTLTAYGEDIKQFLEYLKNQYGISGLQEVTHSFIRSWVVSMMETGMSTRAVNRKLSALRTFFKFLKREKAIEINPMLRVVAPKNSKKLPVFVEKKHMELLFEHVAVQPGFEAIRDRLILELFYVTGMRLSELLNLQLKDINLYDGTVKVLGKRNKERIIPITHSMKEPVKSYLSERSIFLQERAALSNYFFIGTKGNKLTPKTVYLVVKKYLSLVTTIEKKSPHVLRHTFATHLLNNGADINAIKEIMGHSSLAATQVYTHNTIEKLKEAHRLAHPKA